MFKIESYITPLIMGYLDKYVKLRPEDFQLSLWGGDAVLYNLDLRLDLIEKAMQLPIVFQSGHIHELRLHVPWTKLGSDPVVVTINTIECILKLRDTAYSGRSSRASSETPGKATSRQRLKKQDNPDLPPGYLQSLMNKIVNNVSIIINNLIIKFVEDDIVLSLNVKSAECYSVDKNWNRAFVELTAPDFVLRRTINFIDLTVCLDKRDASGKIENYQDPIVYRCSISSRLFTKYENIHGKYPIETKLNIYCERADLSITDTQLPMIVRLIELCLALYYGTMTYKHDNEEIEPEQQDVIRESKSDSSVGEPPPANTDPESPDASPQQQQQGWASWAWSYVPQIMPEGEDEDASGELGTPRRKPPPTVFSFGMYAYKLTIKFKVTETVREKAHYGPRKVSFKPFLYLESEGIAQDVLMEGVTFFSAQLGITNLAIYSQGPCICGAEGEENARNHVLLSGGDNLSNKTTSNYICQSLFDAQSPENLGIPISKILDFDEHRQVYTEQYGVSKYGMFWMDYLYSMAKPDNKSNNASSRSSVSSVGEAGGVFLHENSLTRYVIGPCHLNVSSTTVHRLQKFLDAAYKYEYEPYAKKEEERVDENRPHPTQDQLDSLEQNIPVRTSHLTFLQPVISVLSAEHPYCDVSKKSYRTPQQKGKHGSTVHPLFSLQLASQRFDLQSTGAMYPRRLVQLVSKIAGPPSNLLHHCHTHTQTKLFGFHVGLTKVDIAGTRGPLLTLVPPTSGAMYTKRLLLPMYWKNIYLPKLEKVYELPQFSVSVSKPSLLVVMAIVSSWKQTNPRPADINNNSLLEDVFPCKESSAHRPMYPVLEFSMLGFELKTCKTEVVTACSGTVSSLNVLLYKTEGEKTQATPLMSCPCYTDVIHTPDWLTQVDQTGLPEVKDDCVTFTYQLPRQYDKVQAPSAVLLNIEGISCCLDPLLSDWLSYKPVSHVPQSREPKVELNLELAKAASPLQANMSQVSVPSSDSKRKTLSFTRSQTTGPQSTAQTNKPESEQTAQSTLSVGEKLAKIFPLIRIIQVQVDMKRAVIFIPSRHVDLDDPSSSIVENYQTLARSRLLPETLVVCLPKVTVHSTGLKAMPALQEVPITTVDGSLVGDKIPWSVSLQNFSVYTTHLKHSDQTAQSNLPLEALYLVKPATVSCTVGVSYKYTPPTSDNISALGLCLHTDMRSIVVSSSIEQVKLLTQLGTQTVTMTTKVIGFLGDLSKSLTPDQATENASNFKTPRKQETGLAPNLTNQNEASVASAMETELPCTVTTSGDLASLDTSTSRELEILETNGTGVKLSLWLQWTLPKCEMRFYLSGKQEWTKISALIEDTTLSVDVQDVYSKLKLNMGAVSVSHFMRNGVGKWNKGAHGGILMCCRGNLSHDTHIVTSRSWSPDRRHSSSNVVSMSMYPVNPSARELSHGFLNMTFTRALRKNVKKRLQKLNVEMPQADVNDCGESLGKFFFHKYVSELCLNLAPCDLILCMDPVKAILRNVSQLKSKPSCPDENKGRESSSVPSDEIEHLPLFTSSNLPLLYVDMACTRVFVPGKDGSQLQEKAAEKRIRTTMDHDMCVMQVSSVCLTPNVDNPLPRYALEKELYQEAVQLGITSESGAALADRQYQMDVKGFSVCTGCWSDFLAADGQSTVKSYVTPSTQIPAVEWNAMADSEPPKEIELFPLICACDLKLVLAPAIVNYTPTPFNDLAARLVCGYGLEFNITNDLDLQLSTNQIQSVQQKVTELMKSLTFKGERSSENSEDKESLKDSGLGSEISHTTINRPAPSIEVNGQGQTHESAMAILTPVDLLLTAGRISLTVYTHEKVDKEIHIGGSNLSKGESKLKKKKSKQDLEWKVETKTEGFNVGDHGQSEFCIGEMQDPYMMHMYDVDVRKENVTIPAGTTCIRPFLFVYISQPHTVLAFQRQHQKFETSCYDVLIKGAAESSVIPVSDQKLLPDCSDYSVYWMETRAGRPHHVTGIPPSLYTLSVADFMSNPANICLKLERPVKVNLSFSKLRQMLHFLNTLSPSSTLGTEDRSRKPSPTPATSKVSSADSNPLAIFNKVNTVEVLIEQVVVAMETRSCDEQPELVTSLSNLQMQVGFNHDTAGVVCGMVLNSYLRDFLVKTAFNGQSLSLVGPFSMKADGTYTMILHDDIHFLSQTMVTMATGMVTMQLGQEHVLCLKMIADHLLELQKEMFPAQPSRQHSSAEKPSSEPGAALSDQQTTQQEFIVHSSSDDLRSGTYTYVMDNECLELVPCMGEIVFCDEDREGNSSMTWCYSEPRVISTFTSNPIPFNTDQAAVPGNQVGCVLQYWEALIQQFVDYVEFTLSEIDVTSAQLPEVRHADTRDLVAAQIWRVLVKNLAGHTLILPASLAASVHVDSCFIPSLIPTLQAGLTVEALEVRLSNHLHCLGKETPSKLKPFYMSSCYQPTGEFAVISLDNILLAASHWPGKQARTQTQFSSQLGVDVLEYKTLTMETVVSPFELSGTALYQMYNKVPMLDLDVSCDPVTVMIGQGIIHNLTSTLQSWSQVFQGAGTRQEEVIFGHYVICNDTQQAVRFGQVGTDENLVLQPREMHQYGWRSHKMKQELHICLDGPVWKWCEAVDINAPSATVRSVTSADQSYTLIVTVKRLSNVQNQVIISGLINVSNRLSHHVEVKVVSTETGSETEHHAVAGSRLSVPSYVLDPAQVQGIRFRPWGSNGVWSNTVCVTGGTIKDNTLVKLTENVKTYHVWCRVISVDTKKVQQIFVVLCPLYTVRSHLPHPLYINIDTSKLNIHEQIEAPSRGEDLQLKCPGGDLHQSLTFQFSSQSGKSSTSVTLSTGLIDQLQRTAVTKFDPSSLQDYWRDECWYQWPYSQDTKMQDMKMPEKHNVLVADLEMGDHPTIDLNVNLSELWAGYQTVLVDVAPGYLVTNHCDLDLVFMGTEDVQYNLRKGQTICPPKIEGSFHVGIQYRGTVHMSEPVPVSDEELAAQRYRNDVGRTLYIDSWAHVPVFAHVDGLTQVCFLTLSSSVQHHIRVISIREHFNVSNLTTHSLRLCPFSVPKWSEKTTVPQTSSLELDSHIGCHGNKSDLQPLTFQPLQIADANSDRKHELDRSTEFVHYLAVASNKPFSGSNTEHQDKIDVSQTELSDSQNSTLESTEFHWSFPIRLASNENGVRISTSVLVSKGGMSLNKALCLSGLEKDGVTYFTILEDTAPVCYIQNQCNFPLYFGQTLMNLTLKDTIVKEQTELVEALPMIPVGGAMYYTPPYLDSTFPQILDKQTIPKLHIAGILPDSENKTDLSNLKWSQPIDLQIAADNFVSLPGLADVKVHIQKVALVTHVTVVPITKADVSAKEIRSRLKGKDRTITVSVQNEIKDPQSPVEIKETIKFPEEIKKPVIKHENQSLKLSLGMLVNKLSFVVQNDMTSASKKSESLRLTAENLFCATYPASDLIEQPGYHRNCVVFSVQDLQIDNQIQEDGNYDFTVVLVRQDFQKPVRGTDFMQLAQLNMLEKHAVLKNSSLLHVQVVFGSLENRSSVIEMVDCDIKPLNFYIDDTFVLQFIKDVGNFLPVPLSIPEPLPVSVLKLPSSVKSISRMLSCPVVIGHFSIQPVSVLFSIHASLKVFIASDHTPLSFGKYEKLHLCTTSYHLIRSLAMHYASGALFRAGAVVGSLEILGNPTGLVRSIGTGVADFFRMPYRGLTRGPGAFVSGVSQGTSSMVKNITTGMLKSVTNFASSVSRNMDRLSLDGSHIRRQEESRRHRPDGVGDGLKQGLTGLGISVLGAVAGLADHPIQSMLQTEDQTSSAASGLVTAMGKGLVGVFTKPIGGAAEFVSQTGQGILHGTGLSCLPQPRCAPVVMDTQSAQCGQMKYALKLLQTLPSSDILCCMAALHTDLTDSDVPVTLILTPEILFVISHEEDSQQQSFSLLELDCGVTGGDNPTLSVVWKDAHTFPEDQVDLTNADRVTAFIDGTTQYMNRKVLPPTIHYPTHDSNSVPQAPVISNNVTSVIQDNQVIPRDQTPQQQLFNKSSKGKQMDPVMEGEQLPAYAQQLSENVSDSSSDDVQLNTATLPQYDFKMSATKLAAFLAVFNLTKHRLEGVGFPV